MTPDDYECRRCYGSMYVPDGMDPLEPDVRFCDQCAIAEIETLTKMLRLCWLTSWASCDFDQWLKTKRNLAEKVDT